MRQIGCGTIDRRELHRDVQASASAAAMSMMVWRAPVCMRIARDAAIGSERT